MNSEELAYLAGFFDGEGYVGVHRNPNGAYSLHVTISQKDRKVLDWIRTEFGGNVHKQLRCWNLNMVGIKGYELLVAIEPYTRVKRTQVAYAIDAYLEERLTEVHKLTLMRMKKLDNWDVVPN